MIEVAIVMFISKVSIRRARLGETPLRQLEDRSSWGKCTVHFDIKEHEFIILSS